MKFSFNLLKQFVDIKLKSKELAELITLKTAEVDDIKTAGSDEAWEIKILYNRGDLLSHRNLAREISALTGEKMKFSGRAEVKEDESTKTSDMLKVEIKDPGLCPRYTGRVVKGVKVESSPKWMQGILETAGLRPINNVVDITNYVMLEYGQPMHAFDYDRLSGGQIIVRTAKKGEKISLLDEMRSDIELDTDTLVIADKVKPIAIAGVKGGDKSGITNATHTIVLESANFDGPLIRRTSTKLGLRTNASNRFQYGLDPNQTEDAINRAAELLAEYADGKVASGVVDAYPKEVKPWKVSLEKEYISSLLGTQIPDKTVDEILTNLGMSAADDGNKFTVMVPTHRRDVKTPEDLIEEIGRICGYDNIKPVAPRVSVFSESAHRDIVETHEYIQARRLIKNILKSLAFTETYSYSFVSDETKEIFAIEDVPELLNPVSINYHFMRPSLIPNLLVATASNLRFYSSVSMFETGNVFSQRGNEISEREQIAGILAKPNAFLELKGVVESFLKQLGITSIDFDDVVDEAYEGKKWYHPGRVATIKFSGEIIGVLGDVNPLILKRLGFKDGAEVSQFSFNLKKLFKAMETDLEYEPIPKYPSVIRDISILVGKDVRISKLLNTIHTADKSGLIKDVDVFDIFLSSEASAKKGESPENDGKSVAFHVVYRADDRTLTDKEVDKIEGNIKEFLTEQLGAEIR